MSIIILYIRGGDILVAPSSWQWVNPNEYIHETLPDGIHTLIITCTAMWFQTREDEMTEEGIVIKIIPFHLSISSISSRLLLKAI